MLVCQPSDVAELLRQLEETSWDATKAIGNLRGQPTVGRDELAVLKKEGIKEWHQWQKSLERLGEQVWS